MILTELAAKIATGGSKRKHARAWIEVIQRFLFDRVDTETGALAVRRKHHFAIAILTDETEPSVTRFQTAGSRAKIADHAIPLDLVPPASGQRPVNS